MGLLTSTSHLHHTTPIPSSIPYKTLISNLHNHDILIRLDPEFSSYETLSSPSQTATDSTKDQGVGEVGEIGYKGQYKITDNMAALPAGFWDTTVTFEAEIENLKNGIRWCIRAAMGLEQVTFWKVEKNTSGGSGSTAKGEEGKEAQWVLVEDVTITCNRMLTSYVARKCEENWKGIHGKFVEKCREG